MNARGSISIPRQPGIPKTIGILNILFASVLLLCDGCVGASWLFLPITKELMKAQQANLEAGLKAELSVKSTSYDAEEKAAATPQEKAAVKARRAETEARLKSQIAVQSSFDDMTAVMTEPRIAGYFVGHVLSGIILNLAMLAVGIGLIRLRHWGRIGSNWVYSLKLGRLLMLCFLQSMILIPAWTIAMLETLRKAEDARAAGTGGAGISADQAGIMIGNLYTLMSIVYLFIGAIYPITGLILLNRSAARAACDEPAPPPSSDDRSSWA